MRRSATRTGLALLACVTAGMARRACAEDAVPAPRTPPAESPTPAAGPAGPRPCGAQAARYENGQGFALVVTRAGQVRIENPLRPLTPEVKQVLQVVIAGKVATAYGPDFTALRRGGSPGAVEALLGGPIRWQAALPLLPDPIAIVAEDGAPLAELSFSDCQDPPAAKAPPQPQARKKGPARGEGKSKAAAGKAPPGFSMPQGAIAE